MAKFHNVFIHICRWLYSIIYTFISTTDCVLNTGKFHNVFIYICRWLYSIISLIISTSDCVHNTGSSSPDKVTYTYESLDLYWLAIMDLMDWDLFEPTPLYKLILISLHNFIDMTIRSQIAKFMGPTWGPPGSCRPQMGPMLALWTLLSGVQHSVKSISKYSHSKNKLWKLLQ